MSGRLKQALRRGLCLVVRTVWHKQVCREVVLAVKSVRGSRLRMVALDECEVVLAFEVEFVWQCFLDWSLMLWGWLGDS